MSNPTGPDEEQESASRTGEGTPDGDGLERRFTAPSGFDGSTQIIDAVPEPPTEIFSVDDATELMAAQTSDGPKNVAPQVIPPRIESAKPVRARRSWGWVIAVVLVIAALVALAILGTVLLTRKSTPAVSREDQVRSTIGNFDGAIQKGDLATLRSITCGATRDDYVQYNDKAWAETHARVAAAKQYPVVASIDQVIVHDDHAEANVTTFMAYAPQTRSTRSFDLQFRDEQWKICQNS
ncbi:Rv0361 family membrane protein [Mycobacterium sp. BMJ-28]